MLLRFQNVSWEDDIPAAGFVSCASLVLREEEFAFVEASGYLRNVTIHLFMNTQKDP